MATMPSSQPPWQPGPGGQPWPGVRPGQVSTPPTAVLGGPGQPEYPTAEQALAAAPPTPKRADWRRMLFLGGISAGIALSGLAVLGFVGWKLGPLATIIGIGAAILPVPVLVFSFLWLDRYEPEPVKYLVFCFTWGAFVATGIALLVNTFSARLFDRIGLPESIVAVLVAPFIEETMKAAGPVLLFVVRRKAFSGVIDGIVYCGLSATGFAMVENIVYLGGEGYAKVAEEYGPLAGAQAVILVFFVRIVLSGFAHPLFTSMTAIGLGIAARSADRRIARLAPLAGLLVAMMMHGSWNLMSVVSAARSPLILLYGYFAVMVPIFLSMLGFTLWLRASEGRLVEQVLGDYARAGWFSPPEVASLGTLGRRLAARRWARRVAAEAGAKAMRAYQFDATKLALLRDGMRRGLGTGRPELPATLAEEKQLLAAIEAYRKVFGGRDPYAPRALWDGGRYHVVFPDNVVRPLDAPSQPVVPVPVVLTPPPAPPWRGPVPQFR
jgi:protease PrsW